MVHVPARPFDAGEPVTVLRSSFCHAVILLGVRWCLAYNLDVRGVEEMMTERGTPVDHFTVRRWMLRFSSLLLERFNQRKCVVTAKWHIDAPKGGAAPMPTPAK